MKESTTFELNENVEILSDEKIQCGLIMDGLDGDMKLECNECYDYKPRHVLGRILEVKENSIRTVYLIKLRYDCPACHHIHCCTSLFYSYQLSHHYLNSKPEKLSIV